MIFRSEAKPLSYKHVINTTRLAKKYRCTWCLMAKMVLDDENKKRAIADICAYSPPFSDFFAMTIQSVVHGTSYVVTHLVSVSTLLTPPCACSPRWCKSCRERDLGV